MIALTWKNEMKHMIDTHGDAPAGLERAERETPVSLTYEGYLRIVFRLRAVEGLLDALEHLEPPYDQWRDA